MTTSRCPRSRSTRRDPLPHALRFVRHRPWLFRFGALRLLCGLVVILGRLSKCYCFFLAFPSAVCGVGALGCARGAGALGRIIRVHINTLPPLQGSRRRRPQPCAPALLAEDYNSTLATMEDNAEVRPHPTVRCHPHQLRRIRPGLPESPALAYVPERSWLRWHPHEATVAQTSRGYSFTPSPSGNPRGRSATTATRSASYPLSVLSNRTTTYRISGYPLSTRISVKRAPVVV